MAKTWMLNGFISLNFKLHFIIFIPNVKSELHKCFLLSSNLSYLRICTDVLLHEKVSGFNSISRFQVESKNTMSLTEPHPWQRSSLYIIHEIRVQVVLITESQIELRSQMASFTKNIFRSSAVHKQIKLGSRGNEQNSINSSIDSMNQEWIKLLNKLPNTLFLQRPNILAMAHSRSQGGDWARARGRGLDLALATGCGGRGGGCLNWRGWGWMLLLLSVSAMRLLSTWFLLLWGAKDLGAGASCPDLINKMKA